MSRYTGSTWKLSRRLNYSTLETGKELARRPYGPGQHGKERRKKLSEYGKQLAEKQKDNLDVFLKKQRHLKELRVMNF